MTATATRPVRWRVEQAAEFLGVSKGRAYELARLGIVPCVRLGRTVLFDPERLAAFVENGGKALPGGWRREQVA
jgi:excisionase family DNA binding protein